MAVPTLAARPAVTPSDPPSEQRRAPSARRQAILAFLLVLAVHAVTHNTDGGDGFLALPAAHSLLHDGDLDLSEFADAPWFDAHYGVVDVDGRPMDYFPWTTAAATVPLLAAWEAAGSIGIVASAEPAIIEGSTGRLRVLFASVHVAAAAVVLGLLTRRLVRLLGRGGRSDARPDDAGRGTARRGTARRDLARRDLAGWDVAVWSVVLALATPLWSTASRSLWQHGPGVLTSAGAVLCCALLVGPGRVERHAHRLAVGAGALASLAYWTRPTTAVISLVVLVVIAWNRRGLLPWLLGAMALTHAAMLAANLALVGRPVPPYYAAGRVGWHEDLPTALAANLVSPARGLVVFSPFLAAAGLAAWRMRPGRRPDGDGHPDGATRVLVLALLGGAVAQWLTVSAFTEKWWAGHSIGPRFMTEAVVLLGPLALAVIATGLRTRGPRMLAVGAVAVSVLVHGGAAMSGDAACWNTVPVDVDREPDRVRDWSDPQVLESARSTWQRWSGSGPGRCRAEAEATTEETS